MLQERCTLPAGIAGDAEEFRLLFTGVSDWNRCKGLALFHILAYELDELILNTVGMHSPEIDDAKVRLASFIQGTFDCSVDRAYSILHKIYIPTVEEYNYLMKKEFPVTEKIAPMIPGVYDSVTEEERPWFNFCLNKWDDWRESHPDYVDGHSLGPIERKVVGEFAQSIELEWSKMSEADREGWRRV